MMVKAENKTAATEAEVARFLEAVPDVRRRGEGHALDALHRRVTGLEPKMWGPSIVGYGSYRYRYESGREGVSCRAGFSLRKAAVLYLADFGDRQAKADALFARLGPHTTGSSCLYIKRLDTIDVDVLEALVRLSWDCSRKAWPQDA